MFRLLRSNVRHVRPVMRPLLLPVRCLTASRASFSSATKPPAAAATAAAAAPKVDQNFAGVVGIATENFFDVSNARVGTDISIPYEVTVGEGSRELWQSCFYQHDRLYTSAPFAAKMGFVSGHVLPFALMLFQTVSMSHIDDRLGVLDLGYNNAVYVKPAFAGETFHRSFYVKAVASTTKGTVITMHCSLRNQANEQVFETDKVLLYPGVKNNSTRQAVEFVVSKGSIPRSQTTIIPTGWSSPFEQQIMKQAPSLPPTPASSKRYSGGQLILHTSARPLGKSMSHSLSTLLRFQHPLLMNPTKDMAELVPGPLVFALTTAAAARGLYESMYEVVVTSSLLNKVEPTDSIGAISYIHSATEISPGLEELTVTTLGLKNVDVRNELSGVKLPLALFSAGAKPNPDSSSRAPAHALTRSETDRLTKAHAPVLTDRVVSQVNRRILRQAHESSLAMALL